VSVQIRDDCASAVLAEGTKDCVAPEYRLLPLPERESFDFITRHEFLDCLQNRIIEAQN